MPADSGERQDEGDGACDDRLQLSLDRLKFSENSVEAARHELLVDGGPCRQRWPLQPRFDIRIYSEMGIHIRRS